MPKVFSAVCQIGIVRNAVTAHKTLAYESIIEVFL